MNNSGVLCSANYEKESTALKTRKNNLQEKLDFCFYGLLICAASGAALWWGTHALFGLITKPMTTGEWAGRLGDAMTLWNVLMYFLPFIFYALSVGFGVVGIVSVVWIEIIYQGELFLLRKKRDRTFQLQRVRPAASEGGDDDKRP